MIRRLLLAAALASVLATGTAQALDVAAAKPRVEQALAAAYPDVESLFKSLHQNPELSFQEVRTAARLAKEMRALGFEVTEKVGKTGIVAVYRNGPGPTVLVRTDMDALPMEEKSGLPWASKVRAQWKGEEQPVAHTCGHDYHMAMWTGAARTLVSIKDSWSGTLVFVGQPAEEGAGGSQAMVDDGLFTRFPKPDFMLAQHVLPMPAGTVGYGSGAVLSAVSTVEVTMNGRGGAGHSPHLAIDSVMLSAKFLVDVQSVISREKDPSVFGVITFGSIHGGSASNIMPDSVTLVGTVRSYDPKVHDLLLAGIDRTAKAVAQMAGAPAPQIKIGPSMPPLINTPSLVEREAPVFKAAFGDKAIVLPPYPASEDFGAFAVSGAPSMFYFIGAYTPEQVAAYKAAGREPPPNHSPQFAPDLRTTLGTGVTAMSLAVLELTKKP